MCYRMFAPCYVLSQVKRVRQGLLPTYVTVQASAGRQPPIRERRSCINCNIILMLYEKVFRT